jgi:hypothetical protein
MSFRRDLVLRVSDHALVRFLERAGGFDLAPLRTAIQASLNRAVAVADEIGSSSYTVRADGLRYVIRDGVVVTINHDGGEPE